MAYHFSAHQFEDQYNPRKLGNWEYPKWYPDRPRQRFKATKVIADNNGHLLEGIKKENAWGNYVGTWDLPRRITREYAKKLAAPPERLVKLWGKKKSHEELQQEPTSQQTDVKEESLPTLDHNSHSAAQTNFERRNKSCSALDLRPQSTKLEPLIALERKNEHPLKIKPGTLDEKLKNILDSAQEQEKKLENPEFVCKEIKALPRSSQTPEIFQKSEELKENSDLLNFSDVRSNKFENVDANFSNENQSEIDTIELNKLQEKPVMEKLENGDSEPLKNSHSEFQIAKRFHDANLRHKPLPDVIDDPVFKALNSAKQSHPGGALNVEPLPSAIGWKPYSAPRPTECSKLKVFRPKTGVEVQKSQKELRPKTGDSVYKKRFLPIDLAICWDLKPDDPSDEPKRSPHIDGGNGSAAPAVFTMIRPNVSEKEIENVPGSSQAVAKLIPKGIDEDNVATLPSQISGKTRSPTSLVSNKEAILTCIKPPKEDFQKHSAATPDSLNSISPNAAEFARRHPKTAWTKEDTSKVLSDRLQNLKSVNDKNGVKKNSLSGSPLETLGMTKEKHHQSTPNLICDGSHCGTEKSTPVFPKFNDPLKSRSCTSENAFNDKKNSEMMACDDSFKNGQKKRNCSACKKNSDCSENRDKTKFKAAFKAGVPRSDSTNSSSAAKSYKVPKMRLPYAKRNYTIGTLAPPFSLWRESNGQEYPEHWRLASIYQHSYKPINCRKRPLLASVYQ